MLGKSEQEKIEYGRCEVCISKKEKEKENQKVQKGGRVCGVVS
jgi:hypothetical protein